MTRALRLAGVVLTALLGIGLYIGLCLLELCGFEPIRD